MPLTITRPRAAKLLGWSVTEMNKQTESGAVAVEWTGARRKIPAGELARISGCSVSELADLYERMFSTPDETTEDSITPDAA